MKVNERKERKIVWSAEATDWEGHQDTGMQWIRRGVELLRHWPHPMVQGRFSRRMTVGEWGEIWYADHRTQVQASTYASYKNTLRIIKQQLGDRRLCDVLPIHINQVQDAMIREGYGISQIQKCRIMLNQIFAFAEENGLVKDNPVRKTKAVRDRDGALGTMRYFKDAFTDEEVDRLFQLLPRDLLGNSIRVMLCTGLRVQELLALSPEDIAADGTSIQVNKAIKTVDGIPELGAPKSRRSIRRIPVPQQAQIWAKELRCSGGETIIWSLPGRNSCYSVGCFRRRYYNAIRRVGEVRELSPHCCRHTYITRLQARGVSLELIARLAGHASIVTTEGYTHTSDETLTRAVETLNS